MAMRFEGAFKELQRLVRDGLKIDGPWKEIDNGAQLRTKSGAILNWYSKTGTVQVQGPKEAKDKLAEKLRALLEDGEIEPTAPAPEAVVATEPAPGAPAIRRARAREDKKVFVVHGHDAVAREQLELILHRLKLNPFVLVNTGGGGMTIIEALEQETGPGPGHCRFGIVMMTPDDMGYSKADGPDKAEPRARQNVVLEMGMLIARFGRPNVVILKKGHLEEPSDVKGIIYLPFNDHVKETVPKLVDRLRDAGFDLDPKDITAASA